MKRGGEEGFGAGGGRDDGPVPVLRHLDLRLGERGASLRKEVVFEKVLDLDSKELKNSWIEVKVL